MVLKLRVHGPHMRELGSTRGPFELDTETYFKNNQAQSENTDTKHIIHTFEA